MVFRADARRLLISCPRDVPIADLAIVNRAVSRWNVTFGHHRSAIFVPVWWATHAAAELGGHPQDVLHKQLADDCDLGIALFANRLGTRTPTAESGTVDEIERFHSSGRYVGILRSRRPVDPSIIDLQEATRLDSYLTEVGRRGIVMTYSNDLELSEQVGGILQNSVRSTLASGDPPAPEPARLPEGATLSVQLERRGRPRSSAGRLTSEEWDWTLTVSNSGESPADDVRLILEAAVSSQASWAILTHSAENPITIEQIAPRETRSYHMLFGDHAPPRMRYVMHWRDELGKHEHAAVLPLA